MAKGRKSGGGGRKQSSDRLSTIASKAVRGKPVTKSEIKSLGGSVLGQDETRGKRGKPR